jgi:hypothetical protein
MYLGIRRIRSAGRTSGSIEITLPASLQVLDGVDCHLSVRDGPRPEIVLQTDLSAAQAFFQELWQKLRMGLGEIDDIGDLSPASFTLVLFPPSHWQGRPPLAYADALTVMRRENGSGPTQDGAKHEQAQDALARLLTFMGVVAAQRLGLEERLTLAFGDAMAYLATGVSAGLGTDFERGMAHRAFWGNEQPWQPLGSPLTDDVWLEAQPGFGRVYRHFRAWEDDPVSYDQARNRWYRALMVEMGVESSSVDQLVGNWGTAAMRQPSPSHRL